MNDCRCDLVSGAVEGGASGGRGKACALESGHVVGPSGSGGGSTRKPAGIAVVRGARRGRWAGDQRCPRGCRGGMEKEVRVVGRVGFTCGSTAKWIEGE